MSVKIRLKRMGSKRRPYYRIVVIDSRAQRDGKTIEEVGLYHPIAAEEKQVQLKEEKIEQWISNGAIPSDTVKRILAKEKAKKA